MISFSIVTYKNSLYQLQKVIESIQTCTLDYCVFVIDNSPTDNLRTLFDIEHFHYTFLNDNPGFGAAHNVAIEKAFKIDSDYHIVVNPDIYFEKGTIEKISGYLNNNLEVGLLMPKILYPDGEIQYLAKLLPTPFDWIFRRFYPFKSHLENRNKKFELSFTKYDSIMNVPYLSGCFMAFRLSVLEEVGLFDTGIFMYGEDTDITRRIHQKHKTIFSPEAFVFHEFQKGSHKSFRLLWIHIKAAIYYFNKWGWFFDKERKIINKKVLKNLSYKKKQS